MSLILNCANKLITQLNIKQNNNAATVVFKDIKRGKIKTVIDRK